MGNPHAYTGMMVVLNTISNIILENERETAWLENNSILYYSLYIAILLCTQAKWRP
jgi:hypothetical protein